MVEVPESGQAGAEIEVSPEMIEAGAKVIVEWFDTGAIDDYRMSKREAKRLAGVVLRKAFLENSAQA